MKTRLLIFGILLIAAGAIGLFLAPGVENLPQRGALEGYTRDSTYIYTLAPGKEVHGTKYTIPPALADGTNLAHDSYISYEEIKDASECTPMQFLDGDLDVQTVTDEGVTYLVANTVGAGAGNRYDETVYVFKDYTPCTAIRYYIHYSVFENYEPGAVKEFDRAALVSQFDAIRRALAKSR
jgi:hypothetical protein